MSSVTEEIKPTTNKTETKTESEIENKNSTNDRDENEKEDEKENDDYVPEAGVDDDEDIAEKQSKPTKQTQIDALERIKQRKLVGQLQAIVDKAGFFCKSFQMEFLEFFRTSFFFFFCILHVQISSIFFFFDNYFQTIIFNLKPLLF